MSSSLQASVIGHPVEHSLSPQIFDYLSRNTGLALQYSKVDLHKSELKVFFDELRVQKNHIGCNVTLPYKKDILMFLDELSPDVEAIGAANVVKNFNGRLTGFNTDHYGIAQALKEREASFSSAVIFGAGGASCAAVYAVLSMGIKDITLVNRTEVSAKNVSKRFAREDVVFQVLPFGTKLPEKPLPLFINGTSLGLADSDEASFQLPTVTSGEVFAFDLVYKDRQTPFLREAVAKGYQAIEGINMLIWQALKTYEIWFEKLENRHFLKAQILEFLSA